jgi:predicted permease
MANLKFALRMLLKTPVITSVAVVSLALGIGSNAAIFSLFNQILLRPLPVVEPERLVNLEAPGPKPGSDSCNQAGNCDEVFSYPMFRDLQREQTVFSGVAAHRPFGINVAYQNKTVSGEGVLVSGSYFPALGLVPALGRLLGPEVDEPIGGHPVMVLSHEFWQSHLGGDPDVLGRTITINGQPLSVVGVAPAGFRGTTLGVRPMIFVPITMRSALSRFEGFEDRRAYWVYLFGRLKPGVPIDQARAALEPLYRGILAEVEAPLQVNMSAQTRARFVSKPIPVRDGRHGQSRMDEDAGGPLILLFGITGIIVLIACANIANLLMARAAARAPEMAVRLSIGASRGHLLRLLLAESCLLALVGGIAGLLVARWTLGLIGALLPPEGTGGFELVLDPSVVAFAMGLSLLTGVLFGIVPALHSTRAELVSTLKDRAGQPSGGRTAARLRHGLVAAQFSLSLTLLVAAGLFIQSLNNVSRVDLGIVTEDVVMFRLSPALNGYEAEQSQGLYQRVEAELAAQPGVTGVSAALVAVFSGNSWGTSVMVEGFEAGPDTDRNTRYNAVGIDYYRTLGIPLLAGRSFTVSDGAGAPRVTIVNEAFTRKFGLGRDAVGKRMGRGGLDAELDMEIVGLVRNARYNDVKQPEPPLLYLPYPQEEGVGSLTFYARSAVSPDGLLRTIPSLVARLDPNLPVDALKTLPQQVKESASLDHLITTLSAGFAVLATLLAAVGLYGVLAYSVAQRTREIGVRMALGADAKHLRNMVLRQVARLALVGGAIGLVAALALGRVTQSLLYEMEGAQPAVIAAAVVVLGAVAFCAGYLPARRASRVDPMVALRYE